MTKIPEKKFQTDLVDAARGLGGYAIKMSNQFLVGVPDLLIKLPLDPVLLLECKTEPFPKKSRSIPVALTPMQRKHLSGFQKSGGLGAWCVMSVFEDVQLAYVGVDVQQTALDTEHFKRYAVPRHRGTRWDVREIIRVAKLATEYVK
jgi:hypothetical protein